MKLLHVIQTLDPATGGPPCTATRLAAAQAGLGHEVHLVGYAGEGAETRFREATQRVPQRDRLCLHWLRAPGLAERLLGREARTCLRGLVGDFDLIHLHGVWDPILKAAADTARRRRVPYVVTPHGMLDPWCLGQKRWKKRLALALGYRRMLDDAACLHALNADEKRLLAPLGLAGPVVVLPNGVFLEEIEPLPPAGSFARGRRELDGRPWVLFLSRLHYKKGLDYLAEAFAGVARANQDVQLVVAGPDGGARQDFEQQVRQRGLANRVHLVGPLYGPEKLAALRDAACFCLPSRQEGFSIAVLEALACGSPVVISENCHFPEVAETGAGKVVPLDAPAVARALQDVLAGGARQMGQAGRRLVETSYTWPRIGRDSLAVYEECLSR